jgi:hypothetical protein
LELRGRSYILIYSHYIPLKRKGNFTKKKFWTTVNPIGIASVPPKLAFKDQEQNPSPHSIGTKKGKRQSSPVTGLEWPRGFQEVKVSRLHDSSTGWW